MNSGANEDAKAATPKGDTKDAERAKDKRKGAKRKLKNSASCYANGYWDVYNHLRCLINALLLNEHLPS